MCADALSIRRTPIHEVGSRIAGLLRERAARVRAILVAIAILPAAHATADPASPERVAVVAIDLGPSAPAYLHAMAAHQIPVGLAAAGYEVVPAAAVEARLTGELAACRAGACVRGVGEALGGPSLVFANVDGEGENTAVTIRLHDGRTGARETEVREVCDLCGETELAARIGIAAAALRARSLEARERKPTRPAAAVRFPDNDPPVAPARTFVREPRSMVPGILLGAAGAAAVAGGLYLVAIHGQGSCRDGDPASRPAPGGGYECRYLYATRTPGLAAAGVGVAAVAAGVALAVRARLGSRRIELAPRPGGAAIGVSGSW